jgi:sulfatase modifying factor 1
MGRWGFVLLCACGGSTVGADAGVDGAIDSALDVVEEADAGGCPGTGGPAMVETPLGFCVDSTEVTNAEYAAFLTAVGTDVTGQDAWCSWNASYTPSSGWPATNADAPVVYVDWCDAFAFCKWAGKRLCGQIGGGPNAFTAYADAKKSQWQAACTAGGAQTFPYGSTYDGKACNGFDYGAGKLVTAGIATCTGGYPGLFDMSGNANEWEDSCDGQTGATDHCRFRGGSYEYKNPYLMCSGGGGPINEVRNVTDKTIGFRCCGP